MVEAAEPTRGHTWVVTGDDVGRRLEVFLARSEPLGSRRRALQALERGQVWLNRREVTPDAAARALVIGDRVVLWLDRPGSARRRARPGGPRTSDVPVLFEDDRLIVVNKPPGLLTVPLPGRRDLPSVVDHLSRYLRSRGKRRPLVVHRIDRDTSGLVVFATERTAQAILVDQFRRHEPERVYLALVGGTPVPARGDWRDHLAWDRARRRQTSTHPGDRRGQEGLCHYRVVESFGEASLIEVRLVTGMRNQIRLQAQLRGHALLGERQYVGMTGEAVGQDCRRQALHAARLRFKHPGSGQVLTFEAPLPPDMAELLTVLRGRVTMTRGSASYRSGRS